MRIDPRASFQVPPMHLQRNSQPVDQSTIVYLANPSTQFIDTVRSSLHGIDAILLPYETFHEFLAAYDPSTPGCVVLCFEKYDSYAQNCIAKVRAQHPAVQILLMVQSWELALVVRAIRDGASEVLGAGSDSIDIEKGISEALKNDRANRNKVQFEIPEEILDKLTSEESRIFCLLLQGRTTKQVGSELDLSIRTIHYRKKSIFEKLGVANRLEAVESVRRLQRSSVQA